MEEERRQEAEELGAGCEEQRYGQFVLAVI